jgi:endonuclease G
LRARIPARFWKVIVASTEDGIAAYGFVLEQDLSDVDWEFAVPSEFLPNMYPLPNIEAMTGVTFDNAVRAADQYETVRGAEVGMRAGARRRRRRDGRT